MSIIGDETIKKLISVIKPFLIDLSNDMNKLYENEIQGLTGMFNKNGIEILGYTSDIEVEMQDIEEEQDEEEQEEEEEHYEVFKYDDNYIEQNIKVNFRFDRREYDLPVISLLILSPYVQDYRLINKVNSIIQDVGVFGENTIIPFYGDDVKYATLPYLIYKLHYFIVNNQRTDFSSDFNKIVRELNNPTLLNPNSIETLGHLFTH